MEKTVNLANLLIMAIALLGFAPATGHALTNEPLLWWELRHPGRYINGYNDPQRDIWEVRNEAQLPNVSPSWPAKPVWRGRAF